MNKKRLIIILLTVVLLCLVFTLPAAAATEQEVQNAVEEQGKEGVAGNLFIWFLCTLAFLKASQKIDSILNTLGLNVARTGGNMFSEMAIAAKTIGAVGKGAGKIGTSGGSPASSSSGGFLSGGLAGAAGRQFSDSTIKNVTGRGGSGIGGTVTQAAYQTSLKQGGSFATDIISKVAHGDIKSTGVMTGKDASAALQSYIPSTGNSSSIPPSGKEQQKTTAQSSNSSIDSSQQITGGSNLGNHSVSTSPRFSYENVEIGGGRISGTEIPISRESVDTAPLSTGEMPLDSTGGAPAAESISSGEGKVGNAHSEPRQFAMYSADKYTEPSGEFSKVVTSDGAKWYKQYAQPTVQRSPYHDTQGKIQYSEQIVQKMPVPPQRKDRM